MKVAAIYARVSGDRQRQSNTIASQTEALVQFAKQRDYRVAEELIFEDDGFSGATLERPGLERVRDLAAEGRIEAVLVHEPDRLSRKYAYQVLVMEELARNGVQCVFLKAPAMDTPEDRLLLQFQGMIAEYERAQIIERSRRGKLHRARRGEVSILSGAPYGYRYHKKTPHSDAWYEVIEPQASVVRDVYRYYTVEHMSIGAVTRRLNERGVPTRNGGARWERSTVWAILRNPAYMGRACYGKTRIAPRQSVTRPLRQRGGIVSRDTPGHERPRDQWIEIAVPAIVEEATFALAEERLEKNKAFSKRRTKTPSVCQGLVACGKCGYALSRISTRTTARKVSYYRCLGSDSWRHLNGALCDNRPVRQDLLDEVVWEQIIHLLEEPALIENEIDRRLEAARKADPNQQREKELERQLTRIRNAIERLVNAYQEELITIDELRQRMPELRRREQAVHAELQSVINLARETETYMRLAQSLNSFLARLRESADTLDVPQRQRIVRLLVKDVLVDEDIITIRHSIPIPHEPQDDDPTTPESGPDNNQTRSYLLRSGSHYATLRRPGDRPVHGAFFKHPGFQPFIDHASDDAVPDPQVEKGSQVGERDVVEVLRDIRVDHPSLTVLDDALAQRIQRIVRRPSAPEPVRARQKVHLVDRLQQHQDRPLRHLVFKRRNAQRPFRAIRFGDVVAAHRWGDIAARLDPVQEVVKIGLQILLVVGARHTVNARRTVLAGAPIRLDHPLEVDEVMQRREHPFRVLPRLFGYPLLFRVRVCGTQRFLQRVPSVGLYK